MTEQETLRAVDAYLDSAQQQAQVWVDGFLAAAARDPLDALGECGELFMTSAIQLRVIGGIRAAIAKGTTCESLRSKFQDDLIRRARSGGTSSDQVANLMNRYWIAQCAEIVKLLTWD